MQMKNKTIYIIYIIIISLFIMNGKPPEKSSISYTILETGDTAQLNNTEPFIEILPDQKEHTLFYKRIHSHKIPKPEAFEVDFNKNAVLFISFGQKNTTGYSLELRGIYRKETTLIVKARLISPLEDAMQAQMITHPFILVLIPRNGYKRVELRNERGEMLDHKNI